MKYLRIIIFLFVAGSFNIISLLLARTLPALDGYHQEALAVTVGFLLIANVIFLYILYFWLPAFKKHDRYREFEDILSETKHKVEDDEKAFEEALKRWKDER